MRNAKTDRLVKLGLLGALSIVLTLLVRIPAPPPITFLEYDMGDVPVLFAAYAYGPFWALLLTVVVAVIQGVSVSASSGALGILMHILSTSAGVIPAGLYYRSHKTRQGAFVSLLIYVVCTTVVMVLSNYFISPLFFISDSLSYAAAQDIVLSMILYILIFNVIKPLINSLITFFLYKPISRLLIKPDERKLETDRHNSKALTSFCLSLATLTVGIIIRFIVYKDMDPSFALWFWVVLALIELVALVLSVLGFRDAQKRLARKDRALVALSLASVLTITNIYLIVSCALLVS